MANLRLERRVFQSADFLQRDCERKISGVPRIAFDTAYSITWRAIFVQALRITKIKTAAEEIVQDVFLYAWLNTENYESDRSSLMTWLVMLCRSRSIDYLRSHAFSPRISIDEVDSRYFESDEMSPEILYEITRRSDALQSAIYFLTPVQREVVVLNYYAELSHREIAIQMKIPIGTVKSLLRRAKLEMSEYSILRDI